jgi:hypothetical protein
VHGRLDVEGDQWICISVSIRNDLPLAVAIAALGRDSAPSKVIWDQFNEVLERFPLPPPVLVHSVFRFTANR